MARGHNFIVTVSPRIAAAEVTMHRLMMIARMIARTLASLGIAAGVLAGAAASAQDTTPQPQGWWWSWRDGSFGMNFGGVSYGNGANRVIGSDKLVHQPRVIAGVRGIELRGPVNVVLKQAPNEKLTVHTDDNLTGLIETPVQDGILRISVKEGVSFRSKHAVGVTVEVPHLSSIKVLASGDVTCAEFDADLIEITIQGSGDVRIDALRAGTVAVLIQGSGDVRLSGSAPKQGYVIEGSGNVDAGELVGRSVAVRVAGSGDATLWASDTLSVDIDGSGDVSYRGNPVVRKSINGSGDLTHR
jgi:carbon monoxide dehydrogenase subunit G